MDGVSEQCQTSSLGCKPCWQGLLCKPSHVLDNTAHETSYREKAYHEGTYRRAQIQHVHMSTLGPELAGGSR